jgi:molybdopterin/thiamine biosynthesis adenylyltransferase
MTEDRNERNVRMFGAEGQKAIGQQRAVIVGLGGLGSAVAQDLAYLGVQHYRLIDRDVVTTTSLNRLKGAAPDDVNVPKVLVAHRMIELIQPGVAVEPVQSWLADTPDALADASIVFGCVDRDIHRVEIVKACVAAGIPFFDLATDVIDHDGQLAFGGRVLWSGDRQRCPFCMDLLDQTQMRRDALTPQQRADHDRIYGIPASRLDEAGPSVVSMNTVVAGVAVNEFMAWSTGLREPKALLTYRADLGSMRPSLDPPMASCPYCSIGRYRAA